MKIKMLSNKFYNNYPSIDYSDILKKKGRSYAIVEINIGGIDFGIPFKSNIKHASAIFFPNSNRALENERPGLDLKKTVVLTDESYIGEDGLIDEKEMKFVISNEQLIRKLLTKYINNYKKYVKKPIENWRWAYKFTNTSLKYFWNELSIMETPYTKEQIAIAELAYNIVKILEQKGLSGCKVQKESDIKVSITYMGNKIFQNIDSSSYLDFFSPNYDMLGNPLGETTSKEFSTKIIQLCKQYNC